MFNQRACGVLVHPTSFPGDFGMGDFGAGAFQFVDFLRDAGQKLWQVLPLGPTGFGDSPYQSFSTFAGNHFLISPDGLREQGFLGYEDLAGAPFFDGRRVDFDGAKEYKLGLFRKAFVTFCKAATAAQNADFAAFCKAEAAWLDDYALFVALKDFYVDAWYDWPVEVARREAVALAAAQKKHAEQIKFNMFLQWEFFRQWGQVKAYANAAGVRIIGDIPIFVAHDSVDVWANPELYQLDEAGQPTAVAGVPPDYFSETGQLWGNPLYDWAAHKKTNYAWWCKRVATTLAMVDIVRIDHFRGFEAYWSVPRGETTAVGGKWIKGPGRGFFVQLKKTLGELPIIAEDLGEITEEVDNLRTDAGLPGMKVLHFAFTPGANSSYLPHNYSDSLTVVYSGTHDNNTSQGWYSEASEAERDYMRRYVNVSGSDVAWDLIRLAISSSAVFAIVPLQDVMNLGAGDRMNKPGEASGWWRFRYTADMLRAEDAERLRYLVELFNR
ncbi:MAG: 4-alpha-glucanotransferase [Defluviitaleaceae bacterium]|nr:4-alpha-glucanotransferase [Defluviitaleaceae bacterium]